MKIGTPSLIARNVVYPFGPGPTELLVVRSQFSFEVCKERKLETKIKTHVVAYFHHKKIVQNLLKCIRF